MGGERLPLPLVYLAPKSTVVVAVVVLVAVVAVVVVVVVLSKPQLLID